jgi:hypothetical protein
VRRAPSRRAVARRSPAQAANELPLLAHVEAAVRDPGTRMRERLVDPGASERADEAAGEDRERPAAA